MTWEIRFTPAIMVLVLVVLATTAAPIEIVLLGGIITTLLIPKVWPF